MKGDFATADMFLRIEQAARNRKRECPKCGRLVTRYKNGKYHNHKCEDK